MLIGDQIRKKRIDKGYSQQFLADSIGVSQSKFNRIENGKSDISINALIIVCEVLDTNLLKLLSTVENESKITHPKNYTVKNDHLNYDPAFENHILALNEEIKELKNQVTEITQLIRKQGS